MQDTNSVTQFVAEHKPQLESSGIPQHLWHSLHQKLSTETFDAGVAFQLLQIDYDDETTEESIQIAEDPRPAFALVVAKENGLKAQDINAIYLIDHAWTFRISIARKQLQQYEQLADRMCAIMGIDLNDEARIDKILSRMWRYCHSYTVTIGGLSDEECQPIWYIMDEVGSAVNHADDPNFRLVPFLYLNNQTTYSLLFPLRDCENGETVTRDFVEYVAKNAEERVALLLPWRASDLREHDFSQEEPEANYFSTGHIPESYPKEEGFLSKPIINYNQPLKVYSEYDVINRYLTDHKFQLVDNQTEADVLWLTHHFKEFAEFYRNSPNKFINQFPYEYVLTIKDLLSITCRRAAFQHHDADSLETYPQWLPTTYNLKTELTQFASYYQHRKANCLDNHWIVKPWNLARGMDTHISDSLVHIVRLPITGPKIAQKYIERPVLFYREELAAKVKFDIRYVILLKGVQPLEAYVHRKFFLRFANKPFTLYNFDDYEKHFTVMNYREESNLRHIKCDEFLEYWKEQYPSNDWSLIEKDICEMLYQVLRCATNRSPPCGIPPYPQSRALYAADIMLAWKENSEEKCIQPQLLEINWTPDCERACTYYPDFFNDIFKLLFLDDENTSIFRRLDIQK